MILSDFPISVGVKWIKYNTTSKTVTTYKEETIYTPEFVYQTRISTEYFNCSTGYTFSEDGGFRSTGYKQCLGSSMEGYYVGSTTVHEWSPRIGTNGEYSEYNIKLVAKATQTKKTTYYKGDISYGSIYADKGEFPEEGSLIEGSATGKYCIVKVGGTVYYYEKA